MSNPEELMKQIPFFKKRPALTAGILLLVMVLGFSIMNLDKVLHFKLWLGNNDVVILLESSEVKPSPVEGMWQHTLQFQVMNARDMPLMLKHVQVVDWESKALIRGYTYQPPDNAPIKSGETRSFTTQSVMVETLPMLKNNQPIQGIKIVTNFKTYWLPVNRYRTWLK